MALPLFLLLTIQEEALSMSDRIIVMRDGVIEQDGSPREIYEEPKNLFVASFIGEINTFEAKVVKRNDEKTITALIEGIECSVHYKHPVQPGQHLNILLRPEDIRIEEIQRI